MTSVTSGARGSRSWTRPRALGLLLVGALLLAGCSDSGNADSGTGPIKVMVISSSDSAVYNYPGVWEAAEAYVGDLNSQGGVGGREIEIVECNDKADPNLTERCARQAVDDGVVALVGGLTAFDNKIVPLLEAEGIPWIGSTPLSAEALVSPVVFSGGQSSFAYVAATLEVAQECEKPVAAVSEGSSQSLFERFDLVGMKAEDPDKDFDKVVTIPVGAADFAPFVADMLADDPDCIWAHAFEPVLLALLPELERLGNAAPRLYISNTALTESVLNAAPAVLEKTLVGATYAAPGDEVWDKPKELVQEHASDPSKVHFSDGPDAGAWLGFTIFEQLLLSIDGDITAESILDAANSADAIDTGGLTPPVNYADPFPVDDYARLSNPNGYLWTVKDGDVVVVEGPTPLEDAFLRGYEALD